MHSAVANFLTTDKPVVQGQGDVDGGAAPLGYDAVDKQLVVNVSEAKTVRAPFELYLEMGSLRVLKEIADQSGIVTKRRMRKGVESGGLPFSIGHLRQLLTNSIYIGKVRYRGSLYEGQHGAVVPKNLFERVQEELASSAPAQRSETNAKSPHRLTGKVFDETGDRQSPAGANKKGVRYRYYVSRRLAQGRRSAGVDGWRLPAKTLENAVSDQLVRWFSDRRNLFDLIDEAQNAQAIEVIVKSAKEVTAQLKAPPSECNIDALGTLVRRVEVSTENLTIELNRDALLKALRGVGEITQSDRPWEPRTIALRSAPATDRPSRLLCHGRSSVAVANVGSSSPPTMIAPLFPIPVS
ncbi:MAG: recombinase family protein [Pseudomonadota bacterium]